MNINELPFNTFNWAVYAALAFAVASLVFFIRKWRVIKRDGWRAAFRAWGGPGHWVGQTLLVAAFSSAGGLLLINAVRHFFP